MSKNQLESNILMSVNDFTMENVDVTLFRNSVLSISLEDNQPLKFRSFVIDSQTMFSPKQMSLTLIDGQIWKRAVLKHVYRRTPRNQQTIDLWSITTITSPQNTRLDSFFLPTPCVCRSQSTICNKTNQTNMTFQITAQR